MCCGRREENREEIDKGIKTEKERKDGPVRDTGGPPRKIRANESRTGPSFLSFSVFIPLSILFPSTTTHTDDKVVLIVNPSP